MNPRKFKAMLSATSPSYVVIVNEKGNDVDFLRAENKEQAGEIAEKYNTLPLSIPHGEAVLLSTE